MTVGCTVGVAVHLVTVHTVRCAVGTVRGSVDPVGVTIRRGGVAVGVSSAVGTVHTVHTVGLVRGAVGANSSLDAQERRGDAGGLAIRWKQVVVDIFDEDSLSLRQGKYPLKKS